MNEGRQGSLKLLLIVELAQNFRSGVISPILALFIRGHGLTATQIGWLGIAGMLGWLIFEPLSGVIADRLRKKYMIFFAVAASTVIYASYPRASSIWHFALLAFAMSSVMSAHAVSAKAMTAELLPPSGRGKTYGRFLSVISMGGIVAPIVGGYLSTTSGYAVPFYVSAGIGAIGLVAVLLIRYDVKPTAKESSPVSSSEEGRLMMGPFLKILMIRMLYMFNLLFRQHFMPIYLHESPNYTASEAEIGIFMGIVRVTTAFSQMFLGDLTDRVGCKSVMASSLALIGLSYLGMNYASGTPPLYLLGALQGVFIPAAHMSMMIHLMAIMPEGRTGMVMGIYSEAENVGGMIASPSLGVIYDGLGPTTSMLFVSGILILTGMIASLLVKEDERNQRGKKTG